MSPVDRDRSHAPSLVVTSYRARISIVTSDRDFKDSNIERQLPVIPAALRSIFIMHLRAPLLLRSQDRCIGSFPWLGYFY